ncbi:MAG: PKD domain-containing protein, partial [Bacteroidia bacterium]
QNHWFYLLAEGGSGTNDNQDNYQVDGLGMEKATQIAFRSLIYYLHPSTTYEEARFFHLQAAIDLYGACSEEAEQVIKAWYAVGVGPAYSSPVAEADFEVSAIFLCSAPFEIDFTNLSKNGSSYQWDFGDGTQSSEYAPTHTYAEAGQYSVSLKLDGACGSDEKIQDRLITTQAPPSPPEIIGNDGTPVCGEPYSVWAQSDHEIIWFDDSLRIPSVGSTLTINNLLRSGIYEAKSIVSDQQWSMADTPRNANLAGYGNGYRHQAFKVGQLSLLRSIKVQVAQTQTLRVNIIRSNKLELRSMTFDVIPGVNTLNLMQYLSPDDDYLLTIRAEQLLIFPSGISKTSNIPGVFELGNEFGGNNHFSFEWKGESFCQSQAATVAVQTSVLGLAPIDTASCGPESFSFFVPAEGYTVNWYNWQHQLIHQGENFTTGTLYRDARYFVEREAPHLTQNVGPQIDLSKSFPGPYDPFDAVQFTVTEPIILESLGIYADSITEIDAYIVPQIGATLTSFNDSVAAGYSRIDVNWLLQPGQYELRGGGLYLHVQDQGFSFPYQLDGLMQIDGFVGQAYPLFFDWQLRPVSCWSERVPITIRHGLEIEPRADFDFRVEQGLVHFQNLSKGIERVLWDFGDGASSTDLEPTHLFGEIGSYEVGLQVWFAGCTDYIHRSITIQNSEPIFQIFPNPAQDITNLRIALLETEAIMIEIFDISGRKIYQEELGELAGGSFHYHQLDLSNWASGWYVVRLRSAKQQLVRRLQVY